MTAATINGTGLTASRAVATDGSKNLVSATTTATELNFVSGVTSSIQTQLNTKGTVSSVAASNGVNTVSGAAITGTGTVTLDLSIVNGCRLSLSSTLPVPVTDISDVGTIYLLPYISNEMSVYIDATQKWVTYRLSGATSISLPATTNTGYDIFAYANAGVITLELTAWTNLTTRATALVTQDGVLCKTGALTRRYIGSVRTNDVTARTDDTAKERYLWNYYNRLPRELLCIDNSTSWNYTLTTIRQANGNAANQFSFFVGLILDPVHVQVNGFYFNASSSVSSVYIGLNSTTAPAANCVWSPGRMPAGSGCPAIASFGGYLAAVGSQSIMWLEASQANGTTTWQGTNPNVGGSIAATCGMFGTYYA